jgi:peptidoglycan/LPS O-acetylase OafA/YrhL
MIKEIQSLRAVAIICVLIYHIYDDSVLKYGYIGVDIFFVISGYLITKLIEDKNHIKFLEFIKRRILRIAPIYFLSIAIFLIIIPLFSYPFDVKNNLKVIPSSLIFIPNIFWMLNISYWDGDASLRWFIHLWSLGVEIQFYITFPILYFLCTKSNHKKLAIFITTIFSIILTQYIFTYVSETAAFYFFGTRYWEFLIGSCFAIYKFNFSSTQKNIFFITGLTLIIISIFGIIDIDKPPSFYCAIPCIATALIIVSQNSGNYLNKIFNSRPLILIGNSSYSIYLIHQPIVAFIKTYNINLTKEQVLVLCILIGFFFYRYLEIPISKFSRMVQFYFCIFLFFFCIFMNSIVKSELLTSYKYDSNVIELVSNDYKVMAKNTWKEFNIHSGKKFTSNGSIKVLVVGDSFAKDFFNILTNFNYKNEFEISTYHVSSRCGVLLTDTDLRSKINPNDINFCRNKPTLKNQLFKNLVSKSDIIFVASRWKPWQIQHLNETEQNLLKLNPNAEIVFLGRKSFGEFKINIVINDILSNSSWSLIKNNDYQECIMLNNMIKTTGIKNFIDLQSVVTDELKSNPIYNFDNRKVLLTYDGGHLSNHGASVFSDHISDILKSYFDNLQVQD